MAIQIQLFFLPPCCMFLKTAFANHPPNLQVIAQKMVTGCFFNIRIPVDLSEVICLLCLFAVKSCGDTQNMKALLFFFNSELLCKAEKNLKEVLKLTLSPSGCNMCMGKWLRPCTQ